MRAFFVQKIKIDLNSGRRDQRRSGPGSASRFMEVLPYLNCRRTRSCSDQTHRLEQFMQKLILDLV